MLRIFYTFLSMYVRGIKFSRDLNFPSKKLPARSPWRSKCCKDIINFDYSLIKSPLSKDTVYLHLLLLRLTPTLFIFQAVQRNMNKENNCRFRCKSHFAYDSRFLEQRVKAAYSTNPFIWTTSVWTKF